ncbi:peroxide stress protein YaaA [soil metagenome]
MLFLISPAKSLDYETPSHVKLATMPRFALRSAELIELLRPKTAAQLSEMMGISQSLAELNLQRYHNWSPEFTKSNSKQAALAFNGDVYGGLNAATLSAADLRWAQSRLAILSGLYGVLRPLDRLQPYRLEMGIHLANPKGKDLYAYWGDTIAETLNEMMEGDKTPTVVNLASQEYFKSVDRPALKARVIDCVFEEWKGGDYKIISFFAKRARGLMARYAIEHRISTPAKLKLFDVEGYAFAKDVSAPQRLVFRRRQA